MGGGGKRGGGSSSYVVGHRYYAGLHLVLCHGPVDAITRIIVGERTAWSGSITSSQTIYINAPQLFGGDSREGGVQGYVEVKFGGPAETVSGYLQQKLGSIIPAFRGVLSLIVQQCQLSAMNPYVCPAGYWTIGYGHLCDPKHSPITEEEAESYLAHDLQTALAATLRYCPVLATEPDGRLAAIVDFTFNLGAGRLQTSTLRRRINQRDWSQAANELQRWVYGGGKPLPGLVLRRSEESKLLLAS